MALAPGDALSFYRSPAAGSTEMALFSNTDCEKFANKITPALDSAESSIWAEALANALRSENSYYLHINCDELNMNYIEFYIEMQS